MSHEQRASTLRNRGARANADGGRRREPARVRRAGEPPHHPGPRRPIRRGDGARRRRRSLRRDDRLARRAPRRAPRAAAARVVRRSRRDVDHQDDVRSVGGDRAGGNRRQHAGVARRDGVLDAGRSRGRARVRPRGGPGGLRAEPRAGRGDDQPRGAEAGDRGRSAADLVAPSGAGALRERERRRRQMGRPRLGRRRERHRRGDADDVPGAAGGLGVDADARGRRGLGGARRGRSVELPAAAIDPATVAAPTPLKARHGESGQRRRR